MRSCVGGRPHSLMREPPATKQWLHWLNACSHSSQHLRKQQTGAVAKVDAMMPVAFFAVVVVLLQWPDTSLPSRYITEFRRFGMLEATRVFRQVPRIDPVPVNELLADVPTAFASLGSCTPTDEAARFLLAACHKDLSKGFAGSLMTEQEAGSKWGAGQWLPMPRFETVQPAASTVPLMMASDLATTLQVVSWRPLSAALPFSPWSTHERSPCRRS